MIDEIELAMILYTQGHKIKHDVAHFIKVHQYARLIGKAEHLEEREQFILEVAAICHDIACPMCREKYGNSAGYLQEQPEGQPRRDHQIRPGRIGEGRE